MIEIVFSDSACGSLKVAQHYGEGKYQGGCIGVGISHADGSKPTKEEVEAVRREAEEKARLAWESAVPLGGKTADIYGLNLMLSVGDISENQPGIRRKQTLEHLYSVYPNDEGHQAAQKIFKRVKADLKRVQERAAEGESLRIWYSNQPDEMCGLYWFIGQLNQWKVPCKQIAIVKLPEWEADEKGNIVRKSGWGEVAPEEWHRYLALQKPVLPVFEQSCASHWQELQRENAPLRATLNGQLISAPETLYDDFIFREIAAEGEEFQEAKVIGRVLGKYQLGISDSWVALRIEKMIREGKLEAVSAVAEDTPIYHRVLKKCTYRL
ncbi:DUF3658 domain-containing protein [Desulfosporosinus meridiei]|uniref:DUF1835 domain-containing protein n=1 Tax=Desulfosporosinus meridiei (strain ATCC BAA-275 / DSM 13257 / KCTC 12902 / NCIMB 13706 / S10) TaxID=768704 RepID=J7ISX8_DESMD|nr:DUF3658 domain-containing protein [Desulfosporosinus meridiei]AFQ42233.1 protein of unknown function (DUF1835) [Desulfosporosinus meridiei DSM 13257]